MTGCRIDNRIGHARALSDLEQQIAVVKFGILISASGKKCCRGKKDYRELFFHTYIYNSDQGFVAPGRQQIYDKISLIHNLRIYR